MGAAATEQAAGCCSLTTWLRSGKERRLFFPGLGLKLQQALAERVAQSDRFIWRCRTLLSILNLGQTRGRESDAEAVAETGFLWFNLGTTVDDGTFTGMLQIVA